MDQKKPCPSGRRVSKILAGLIFFIFITNYLAINFYWYSAIWYFDMPMHFLGGLWWGLVLIWFYSGESLRLSPESKALSGLIFKVIVSVLVVGILYELYEFLFYNYFGQNPFNTLDTISDIFFDLAGASFAILYFLKGIMSNKGNTVQ